MARPATALLILALVALAWVNRFTVDDAFIAMRYAEHLINGHGLTWNPGEAPVEGYTNFLWVLLLSLPLSLGVDPVQFAHVLGLGCFVLTLLTTLRLSSLLLASRKLGLLVIVLLGTNTTFSSFATGGMETQLQALLLSATVYLAVSGVHDRRWSVRRLGALSVLASLAMLTRLDSAVVLIVVGPMVMLQTLRDDRDRNRRIGKALVAVLPFVLMVGGWFIWKLAYYGDVLPNTFHAKVTGLASWPRGASYVYSFLAAYLLLPMVFIGAWALPQLFRRRDLSTIAAAVAAWCAYVIAVGGDWMEFRFMVPILPLLVTLTIWLACTVVRQVEVRGALVLMLLLGPVHHHMAFDRFGWPPEPLHVLTDEPAIRIGQVLGGAFHGAGEVVIATRAAGAIPYYSKLRTIDMLGLNDTWVARHGQVIDASPGHQRLTPLHYLRDSGVHMVAGFTAVTASSEDTVARSRLAELFGGLDAGFADALPGDAAVIELPIGNREFAALLYLRRSPIVDQVIQREGWRVLPIGD